MIRSLNFTDFRTIQRLQQAEVGLNLPNALIVPHSPLTAALTQSLPVHSLGSHVYLNQQRDQPGVFVQTRVRNNREEWEVLAVGTIGTGPSFSNTIHATLRAISETPLALDPTPPPDNATALAAERDIIHTMWQDTLEYAVQDAGSHGVHRVFAKLALDTPEVELFHRVGFYTYTREHIFSRTHTADVGWTHTDAAALAADNCHLREQRPTDTAAILRLYDAVTPPNVRHAEALTSRSWRIGAQVVPRGVKERAWLLEHGPSGRAVAYVRILSHRSRHLIRLLTLRDQDHKLDALVRFALHHVKAAPDTHIFASVRDYQLEQAVPLESHAFMDLGEQVALVKHTVQHVRAAAPAPNPILVPKAARIEPTQFGTMHTAPPRHPFHTKRNGIFTILSYPLPPLPAHIGTSQRARVAVPGGVRVNPPHIR